MGFKDLSYAELWRIITRYEEGLASAVNYPCGSTRAQVRRWLKAARAELDSRHNTQVGATEASRLRQFATDDELS